MAPRPDSGLIGGRMEDEVVDAEALYPLYLFHFHHGLWLSASRSSGIFSWGIHRSLALAPQPFAIVVRLHDDVTAPRLPATIALEVHRHLTSFAAPVSDHAVLVDTAAPWDFPATYDVRYEAPFTMDGHLDADRLAAIQSLVGAALAMPSVTRPGDAAVVVSYAGLLGVGVSRPGFSQARLAAASLAVALYAAFTAHSELPPGYPFPMALSAALTALAQAYPASFGS